VREQPINRLFCMGQQLLQLRGTLLSLVTRLPAGK
jgi:hypothetical protein